MGQHCTYNNMLILLKGRSCAEILPGFVLEKGVYNITLEHRGSFRSPGRMMHADKNGNVVFAVLRDENTPDCVAVLNLILPDSAQVSLVNGRVMHPQAGYINGISRRIKERLC